MCLSLCSPVLKNRNAARGGGGRGRPAIICTCTEYIAIFDIKYLAIVMLPVLVLSTWEAGGPVSFSLLAHTSNFTVLLTNRSTCIATQKAREHEIMQRLLVSFHVEQHNEIRNALAITRCVATPCLQH